VPRLRRAELPLLDQRPVPDQKVVDKVIEVQMPLITFSIDSGDKEVFEKIRYPAKFERVISSLDLINERKRPSAPRGRRSA